MGQSGRAQLLDLLEEMGAIDGVRGALIATADGQTSSNGPARNVR